MTLEDQLRDSLSSARTDERWAVPVSPDALDRVRRLRRRRQRRTAVLSVAACAALAGGAVLVITALPGSRAQLGTSASGGVPEGSPAPGITPAWVPTSGRDWLLSNEDYAAFEASHPRGPAASPGPGEGRVPSPAPLGPASAELLSYVQGAGLPGGATLRREDAPGGDPDSTIIHVTLADGTPVAVIRRQLARPFAYHQYAGDGVNAGATLEDVPGTTSAAAVYPAYGYGFGKSYSFDAQGNNVEGHGVNVVTRSGVLTSWAAPHAVPLATVRGWALAAAQHAGD